MTGDHRAGGVDEMAGRKVEGVYLIGRWVEILGGGQSWNGQCVSQTTGTVLLEPVTLFVNRMIKEVHVPMAAGHIQRRILCSGSERAGHHSINPQ